MPLMMVIKMRISITTHCWHSAGLKKQLEYGFPYGDPPNPPPNPNAGAPKPPKPPSPTPLRVLRQQRQIQTRQKEHREGQLSSSMVEF